MSGITSTGFETKDLATVLQELETAERGLIRSDFVSTSTSVGGILNGIFGSKVAELWAVGQAAYASLDPGTATDQQLENIGALRGVSRQAATASTVIQSFVGTPATVIPAGSIVSDPATPSKKFTLDAEVILDGGGLGSESMTCTELGPTVANAGTLTNIDTPIAGWTSTTNAGDADTGRNVETDAAYRLRQEQSLAASGQGSRPSLLSALRNLSAVTSASVFTNTTAVTVDGAPPHTVEAIVEGGDDQAIFDLLNDRVALGLSTYGNTVGTSEDTEGNVYAMMFSRPDVVEIKLNITLKKLPASYIGDAEVKQELADLVNALLPGKTSVTSKLEGFCVDLGGVTDTTLFQQARLADSFGTANVTMGKREVAHLNVGNITLVSTNADP